MSRLLSLSLSTTLVSVLALSIAPACGTSDAAPPVAPNQVQPATTGTATLCVEVFTRNRTCTDQYIPALVDVRAKYDRPAGIAAEVAADRDGVIAQAKAEWATDSQPAAIDATCNQIVANPGAFTQADADAAQACLALTDCTAYTACIMPQFEKRFAH